MSLAHCVNALFVNTKINSLIWNFRCAKVIFYLCFQNYIRKLNRIKMTEIEGDDVSSTKNSENGTLCCLYLVHLHGMELMLLLFWQWLTLKIKPNQQWMLKIVSEI